MRKNSRNAGLAWLPGYHGNRHTKLRRLGFELGEGMQGQTQEFAHVWKMGVWAGVSRVSGCGRNDGGI